jgi:Leucine-rich repeat (LRR) protein
MPLEQTNTIVWAYLDDSGVQSLAGLANSAADSLQVLWLDRTQISNIGAIPSMPKLQWLTITGSAISDLTSLSRANKLVRLFARSIPPGAVASLPHLPDLVELRLGTVRRFELESMEQLPSLRDVSIWDCPDAEDLSWLKNCKRLERLTLHSFASLRSLSALKELPKLRYLSLQGPARIESMEVLAEAPSLSSVYTYGIEGAALSNIGFERRSAAFYYRQLKQQKA